jgi:phenol hydroxylase P3 protein
MNSQPTSPNKKLSLKEKYALMTRDLSWETTYQPMDKIYPQTKFEGIKIHDWDNGKTLSV